MRTVSYSLASQIVHIVPKTARTKKNAGLCNGESAHFGENLHRWAYLSCLAQYPVGDLGWDEPQEGVRPAPYCELRRCFPRLKAVTFMHVMQGLPVIEYCEEVIQRKGP